MLFGGERREFIGSSNLFRNNREIEKKTLQLGDMLHGLQNRGQCVYKSKNSRIQACCIREVARLMIRGDGEAEKISRSFSTIRKS